jgi:2-aminoethylphosphonate-pyruvate transaminase
MPKIVSLTPAVFHLPEPVNEVSRHYGEQPIVPRGPRLKPLMDAVRNGIRTALEADAYEPVMLTGSGSTAMAAVIGSCMGPKERFGVIRNGAYGDRMLQFAKRVGQPTVDLCMPYGDKPDLERIEQVCRDDEVDTLAMVYGCTSSCGLNPIEEVGAIAKRYGKKLFIDGVSALFIELMDLEQLGVSAVMACCNKGLHSHPNLTFALLHRDLMEAMEHIEPRAPSLELYQIWLKQKDGSHPYTIDPMSLCQVRAALDYLSSIGGVAGRHRIYQQRCALLRDGYERLGLRIARWEGMPLQSIGTALHIPQGVSYDAMAERLASEPVDDHTFEIYAAQGKLSDKLFRVFHMGEYPLAAYELFLKALERVL